MKREEVFNFSAGPSVLPPEALEKAAAEILNYNGSGMSVMEMSHRSAFFQEIFDSTKQKLKEALKVPDTHEILFLQGGASLQFSMVPLNLLEDGTADYAVTGNFSNIAMKEARKYGDIRVAASSEPENFTYIPDQSALTLTPGAKYFYYCANNTIYGTEWNYVPETEAPVTPEPEPTDPPPPAGDALEKTAFSWYLIPRERRSVFSALKQGEVFL